MNYDRNRRSGNEKFGRRNNNRDREMYKTTCASCGNQCEVPFKPTGSKPVFCNSCFKKMDERGHGGKYDNARDSRRPRHDRRDHQSVQHDYTKQLTDLGQKLDKIIRLLSEKSENTPQEVFVVEESQSPVKKNESASNKKPTKKSPEKKTAAKKEVVLKEATPVIVEDPASESDVGQYETPQTSAKESSKE